MFLRCSETRAGKDTFCEVLLGLLVVRDIALAVLLLFLELGTQNRVPVVLLLEGRDQALLLLLLLVVVVAGDLLLPLKALEARDHGVRDRSLHEALKIELIAALELGLQPRYADLLAREVRLERHVFRTQIGRFKSRLMTS
jgi:hypothetical protein